jgi:tRNA threonylcarbamoyladenosine dehydratase
MDIVPEAHVEAMCEMYTDETEENILSGRPDYVIDAIDNIDTKVALLAACKRRNIPVLCSAGAGAKADPTRLRFADISQSAIDPLARSVRYRLKKDFGISNGIQVLLSTEKPRCGLVYCGDDGVDVGEYQVIPNFRIRTIPVLGTTPAIFGLAAAGHVLCELAEAPLDPYPMLRISNKVIQTQYDRLEQRESENFGVFSADTLAVDIAEVEILIKEVWQGASARAVVPPADDQAVTRGLGNLVLTRWDRQRNGCVDNLVLLTKEEADEHDECDFEKLKKKESEFVAKVEKKLARARRDFVHSYY